jgi:hypothetical protein
MRWSHRCRENAFSLSTCRRVRRGHGSGRGLVSPSSRIGREMATKRTGVCGADVLVDAGVGGGVVVGCGLPTWQAVLGGDHADDAHLVVLDRLVLVLDRPGTKAGSGGQEPAEMPGAGGDPEGPVEIQLSLRWQTLSLSDQCLRPSLTDFTTVISDFNKTTKQKIGPPAATLRHIVTSSGITAEEPKQNPVLVKRVRPQFGSSLYFTR